MTPAPPPLPAPNNYQPTVPPRIAWGWVLALTAVTFGAFLPLWLILLARWVRRIYGRGEAFPWAVTLLAVLPFAFFVLVVLAFLADSPDIGDGPSRVGGVIALTIVLALYVTTLLKLRADLLAALLGLQLSSPLSVLGGPVYLQAKLNALTPSTGLLGLS